MDTANRDPRDSKKDMMESLGLQKGNHRAAESVFKGPPEYEQRNLVVSRDRVPR